jgi:hypothetical protein
MVAEVDQGRRQERFDGSAPDRLTAAVEGVIPEVITEPDQPAFLRTEPLKDPGAAGLPFGSPCRPAQGLAAANDGGELLDAL